MSFEIMSISDLAKRLADNYYDNESCRCDFATLDKETCLENIEDVAESITAWHGLHHINPGFDSNKDCFVSDYYGGFADHYGSVAPGQEKDVLEETFYSLVYGTMDDMENVNADTVLFVEFFA